MIDLVDENYSKDIAFYQEKIKKVDKEMERIKILAWQTTDDRMYNTMLKELVITKQSFENSLEEISKNYSRYKKSVKAANEIF